MTETGMEQRATDVLAELNRSGGYSLSLVCTEQGLLIAAAGEADESEVAAGLTSLLDDLSLRAIRDYGVDRVDEMTLLCGSRGRLIVRTLAPGFTPRVFLVVQAPRRATWRRLTNVAGRKLSLIIRPLLEVCP